ncbi:MAG: GNAT family N-acetyltransferase [Chloroflexota bacterium]
METQFTIDENPNPDDIRFLSERIYEYNVARTGISDGRLLALFVRDADKQIIAGLEGWTWGGCLYVEHLWVHERLRGQGHGTQLLRAAEDEAVRRGCVQSFLTTHSFQAPAYYERSGYEIVGAFDEYPRGHQQFFMRKELVAQAQ